MINNRRQLEMTSHDSAHSQIFIEFFPTECTTLQLQMHFLEFIITGSLQNSKPIRRKANNSAISKFQVHHPFFYPNSYSDRFSF